MSVLLSAKGPPGSRNLGVLAVCRKGVEKPSETLTFSLQRKQAAAQGRNKKMPNSLMFERI